MEAFTLFAYILPISLGAILFIRALTLGGPNKIKLKPEQITDDMIRKHVTGGQKIQAMKLHRMKYKSSLKEAKEAIESLAQN